MLAQRILGAVLSPRLLPPAAVVVTVLAFDQATKVAVRTRLAPGESWPASWETIRVVHVTNSGAALGIFQDYTTWLIAGTFLACIWLAWLIHSSAAWDRAYAIGLSLVLGGALGNLLDRVRLGEVTDLIRPLGYPVFNIADIAIVVGLGAVLLLGLADDNRRSHDAEDDENQRGGAFPSAPAKHKPHR